MKKLSKKIVVLSLLIIITLSTLVFIYCKKENGTFIESEKTNDGILSIMLEKEIDGNEYIKSTVNSFPTEYYSFNAYLSKCENGSKLRYNEDSKTVNVETAKTDKCYAYFDKSTFTNNYTYEEKYNTFIAPLDGIYKVELWGAQGGDTDPYKGGRGAYTKGNIELKQREKLYIFVCEAGSPTNAVTKNGGYNGGGSANTQNNVDIAGTGGGATDIRLEVSSDGLWNNFESLKSRIMVAAGGGGSYNYALYNGNGSAGGTLNGIAPGYITCGGGRNYFPGILASQSSGASIHACGINSTVIISVFGQGGNGVSWAAGGGGGYYGGGYSYASGASGGNSFISGFPGCNAIAKNSTINSIIHTGGATHYSGKVFTETQMIAGTDSMPNPNGGIETGHSGNGYAKITLVK